MMAEPLQASQAASGNPPSARAPEPDPDLVGRTLVLRLNESPPPQVPPSTRETALEWGKVLAGPVFTLLITGIVGSYVNAWLTEREARETNERLYAQLLTQREQSDTLVRKDMFAVVITRFLSDSGKRSDEQDWRDKVLQLELLANNFNQSLDLAPLFKDVVRQLPTAVNMTQQQRADLQERIDQTASTLNHKQINSLARRGVTGDKKVSAGRLETSNERVFLHASAPMLRLTPHTPDAAWASPEKALFAVEVLRANLARRELEVRLAMHRSGREEAVFNQHFWVGRYDFPMLSNVQLPFGLRAAVVITAFDVPDSPEDRQENSLAHVHLVVFPTSSASFKERQDYDDILLDMVRRNQVAPRDGEVKP